MGHRPAHYGHHRHGRSRWEANECGDAPRAEDFLTRLPQSSRRARPSETIYVFSRPPTAARRNTDENKVAISGATTAHLKIWGPPVRYGQVSLAEGCLNEPRFVMIPAARGVSLSSIHRRHAEQTEIGIFTTILELNSVEATMSVPLRW